MVWTAEGSAARLVAELPVANLTGVRTARPVGGIVMAHFGDTRGRKRMFALSVLLMAIPTLLLGPANCLHVCGEGSEIHSKRQSRM